MCSTMHAQPFAVFVAHLKFTGSIAAGLHEQGVFSSQLQTLQQTAAAAPAAQYISCIFTVPAMWTPQLNQHVILLLSCNSAGIGSARRPLHTAQPLWPAAAQHHAVPV
jgi:hypothetical protein